MGDWLLRKTTSDLGPGGKAEGPGRTAIWALLVERDRQGWESFSGQLEVQADVEHVAGELVGAGAPQEGLRAFTLLLLSGSQGLFVDLYSF